MIMLLTNCAVCDEAMMWVECPTGGWWSHINHPADDHDGIAPLPVEQEDN